MVDDFIVQVPWTNNSLWAQEYDVEKNILYQNNRSTTLLEENGRTSVGKRSKIFNIRYYFMKDVVDGGRLQIMHCPMMVSRVVNLNMLI